MESLRKPKKKSKRKSETEIQIDGPEGIIPDVLSCDEIENDSDFAQVENDVHIESTSTSEIEPTVVIEDPSIHQLGPNIYPVDEIGVLVVANNNGWIQEPEIGNDVLSEDVDPCEEALATAPASFESGDFLSLPSLQRLPKPLEILEEEVDVFLPEAKPSHVSILANIYNNYLLENNESYIKQFLETLQPSTEGFELFELLSNYLRAYNNLVGCEKSLSALKDSCDEVEKRVWSLSVKQLNENCQCEDGITLTANYKVHIAEYNETTFSQLTRTLKDIKELLKDSFSLYTYSVQLSKTQIEHFLYKNFGNFNLETYFDNQSYAKPEARGFAQLLRRTITVFFHFLRKPLLHALFTKDLQDWVNRCAGLLLRIATIEDHIFLLNHVIRLPPKVVSKFGASLVHVPPIPIPSSAADYATSFTHLHLDYALTLLATILSPVSKRAELLNQYQIALKTTIPPHEASLQWVLVDSDGEDEAEENPFFKEMDLIALLHQVPFDKVFRRVLLIYTEGGEDVHDLRLCSEHSLLKLLAFGSHLISIFGNGLRTYYTDQYRQLVKLLGRLILHTIQYITDQVECFIEAGGQIVRTTTPVFREYDIFLYDAVGVLITGKNVGTAQFLAAVPYHLVSTGMLWEIYCLLTKWDPEISLDVSCEFEHELLAMSESNAFYALTTMSNMALTRQGNENQFVKRVTLHLFEIGFLSSVTRETCSKNVRDLLGNLSNYPRVISNLLQNIKQKIEVLDKLALFLVRELAFDTWKPTNEDLQLLSHWMLNFHTFSLESQVARFVIHSMNWDFGHDDQLFLQREIHLKVALLVVESHFKWERPQNLISESVKQLSAWVTKNPDFTSWAWDILRRLHLHGFDWNKSSPPKISSMLVNLPSFESHSELEWLRKAMDEKNPIACTVALLLTPIGHSLPLLCTDGFSLIEVLLQNSKFEVVMHLLFLLVPLFANSKESIINCNRFRNILTTLLAADMTYVRMAKNLITAEFPGLFTKMFGNMIHTQLDQFFRFGTTAKRLLSLWLNLLTKIQGWNKDNNILYLLDVMAHYSFANEECKKFFHYFFYSMYKEIPVNNSSGITSFLFNWSYSATTVLPNSTYPHMPYFVYFILTIESSLENESGFWKSLSKALANPKTTLESAIKKACGTSKYSTTSNYLTIYRWSQHALELPPSHPLLLIFWQKFFVKYFHRSATSENHGGIGERFFEGLINTGFQKKLKKRLHELLKFYSTEIDRLENETINDENIAENTDFIVGRLKNSYKLLNGMALWIEDPLFHGEALYVPALPPQCLPVELHTLLEGDTTDWQEYVDFDSIHTTDKSVTQSYLTLIHRLSWIHPRKGPRTLHWNFTASGRKDEFLKRLNSYDAPLEPPPVPTFPQILPSITTSMYTNNHDMNASLKIHLKNLIEFAQQFSLHISKHTALDCIYLENLPHLYTISDSEALVTVECSSGKKGFSCAGPGHVIFNFSEARLNERVGHIIHHNRTDYHNLVGQNLVESPPLQISVAAVLIEDFITNLIMFHRNLVADAEDRKQVEGIGIELFYLIVKDVGEETNFYPPTRQLFSSFLEVLGHEFVESDPGQCLRLVSTSIQNPGLVGTLTPHMNLVNTNTETLLEIYENVINIPDRDGDLAFVILSKLDLLGWLKKQKPKLVERSKLISLMWKALIGQSTSSAGDNRNQMVHGTHRSHLKTMLLYDFPQHYGEILNLLLEDSEKNVVPLELWYDFFSGLARDTIRFSADIDPFFWKRELKRFSMEIDILRYPELVETAVLLANHFKKERLSYGIYGLYPKYRAYVGPLSCFHQIVSYSLISSSLKNSKGIPSQQIVEAVWPLLRDLYNPWILPYDQRIVQQECAQWIQQMNFDSASFLQPWISSDSSFAALFMNDFTDGVLFLAETLPGCPALFSHLWNYYADNYAYPTVKEHVIALVNNCFISIPWALFWPTIPDMESMNKVIEKYLPACHNLMGVVFAQINWTEWVGQVHGTTSSVKNRCYGILLNLTVHLATDVVARESPTWTSVMQVVQSLNWEYILPNSLEPVLNWFVMSVDPRVVLSMDMVHHLDQASFQLLRISSGYGTGQDGIQPRRAVTAYTKTDLNRKRYLFVRTYIRLLLSASTKYKTLLQTHSQNFEKSLQTILDDILDPVREEKQERSEFGANLKEVVGLISNHYLGTIARNAAIGWLQTNKDIPLGLIYEIIHIAFSAKVPSYITIPLIETALPLVFRHSDGNWKAIVELIVISDQTEQNQYFEIASKDGHYLVLYSLLLNRVNFYSHGALQAVSSLTEILKNLKPKDSNETVLPLIYGFFFKVSIALLNEGAKHMGGALEKAVKRFLNTLCLHLISVGDDKQGWVLLGVLGLTKASLLTVRGRLFARILSVFLMAQLPVNAPVRLQVNDEDPVSTTKSDAKPHGELESSFHKLEELKLNRQYIDLVDCIDFVIPFIRDPSNTLSSYEKFIRLLTCQLFTEPYLLQDEFHNH